MTTYSRLVPTPLPGRMPHAFVLDVRAIRQMSGGAHDVEFANAYFERTVPRWCAGTIVDETTDLADAFGGDRPGLVEMALQEAGVRAAGGLWIMAHGESGYMQLCASGLGEGNLHRLTHVRRWLRGPCVLVSCNVASAAHEVVVDPVCHVTNGTFAPGLVAGDAAVRSGVGYRFLRALANTVGHPVVGSLDRQLLSLQYAGWTLTGTTIRVGPTGGYEIRRDIVLSPQANGQCLLTYPDERVAPAQVVPVAYDRNVDPARF